MPRARRVAVRLSVLTGPPAVTGSRVIVGSEEEAGWYEGAQRIGKSRVSARSLEARLAVLALGRKMGCDRASYRGRGVEPGRCLPQRPVQSVEPRFLRCA